MSTTREMKPRNSSSKKRMRTLWRCILLNNYMSSLPVQGRMKVSDNEGECVMITVPGVKGLRVKLRVK